MAIPALAVRIDFNRDGDFSDASENVTDDVISLGKPIRWTRGRSADFSAEATGAATFTLRNDDGRYNTGTLLPGLPVHIQSVYSAVTRAHFYGFIERVSPDPRGKTITVTCYDPLRQLRETDIVVAANTFVDRTAHDLRTAVLEDFERGTRNLILNPSFETNTTGWLTTGGTLTRTTGDHQSGAACGSFAASGAGDQAYVKAYMAPVVFDGQVYRWSIYLKAAGTQSWVIGLGISGGTSNERTVTVTTSWQRFTITYEVTADSEASTAPLVGYIESTAADTVLLDAATVTRGQALYPYADAGTGRWPNWVGNGSFDGGLNGWFGSFTNLLANGSFEVNTTGWASSAIASLHAAATSFVQTATTPMHHGTGRALVGADATGGVHNALNGTYKAGISYRATGWMMGTTGGLLLGIGSSGTPSDKAESGVVLNTSWTLFQATWTPSSDRTDAVVYTKTNGAGDFFYLDDFAVTEADPSLVDAVPYTATGPGGGGGQPASYAVVASPVKYGSASQQFVTRAAAGSGRVYDFNHLGSYFVAGQPYVASLWVYPSSSFPYKVGIGANTGDATGTWDEASTTGTATANTWTQITVTWTPSADRSAAVVMSVLLYIHQTDTTARTITVEGVRVIPGSSADAFESNWELGPEADLYLTSANLSGSALSTLSALNEVTGSRHFIRPEAATPWYTYVTIDRDSFAALVSQETYDDDLADMTNAEIDRDAILNVVPIYYLGGVEYYSDATSVNTYGPRLSSAIAGSAYYPDRTIPDALGPALIARYKDPRARPVITVQNRFPSQLVRELGEVVTLTFARLGITARDYQVLTIATTVTEGGHLWTSVYTIEEVA